MCVHLVTPEEDKFFKQRKINYSRQITEQKAENLDLDPISATITCVLLGSHVKYLSLKLLIYGLIGFGDEYLTLLCEWT